MKKIKKKSNKKAGVFITVIAIAFVLSMLLAQDFGNSVVYEAIKIEERKFQLVPHGDPAEGESGFFYAMYYPHEAVPGTAYALNLSTGSAYEYTLSVNASMTGETPFDTTFDILIKWGWSDEHGWNSTGELWEDDWVFFLGACAALGISADTNFTEIEIAATDGEYRWMHYYMNNAGVGYTISHGEQVNVTDCKPYAWY